MKKTIVFAVLLALFINCKDEAVEKPNRLIDKDVMVDIMYDLSVLEAIKYQNPNSLTENKINPNEYIYKKYKIDSIQFAQSNKYYAADYNEYKLMFEKISQRLEKNKTIAESLAKREKKKTNAAKIPKPVAGVEVDSLKKKPVIQDKFTDSKWPLYTDEYQKILFLKRF